VGLQILSKRADGYHELDTVFYPVPWCDVLEILPTDELSFSSTGILIPGKGNLCLDAYHLLKKDFDLAPVHIHLHKVIPIGAGLGGGSSDAAFTLKGLNEMFDLGLSHEQLRAYAVQLGADCPFFIENRPMRARGIGEQLEEVDLDLSDYHLLLVKPAVHVSTAAAYAGVVPGEPERDLLDMLKESVSSWELKNDFEQSVFEQFPQIADIKEKLYEAGAIYAAMSGSGSTVFGLFEKRVDFSLPDTLVFWS
jgi:4-diphosphocytidyl-2-C-methyl-D-erythritol kinase